MARIEPPKLAAWMLEYLVPAAERDEALAGDLEEHYRAGRSDAWYWRQAAAAVATGWGQYLNRRRAILLFALLWSMLAPAWVVVIDRAQNNSALVGALWRMDWPFSTLANFGLWLLLSVPFVWAGILFFALWHGRQSPRLDRRRVRQALLMVPLVFLPIYFATFVVLNLFSFPGPAIDRRTLTILGEITDARRWAMFMRLPYFLTTVIAMWRMVPGFRVATAEAAPAVGGWTGSSALPSESPAPAPSPRFFAFVVVAGLMNALLCGFLLCRLPDAHFPSLSSLLLRAAVYVALGAVAGSAGAWIYWNNPASPFRDHAPVDFRLFALACAAGWIWMPAVVLFYEQITPVTAILSLIGAFALAAGLRRIPLELESTPAAPASQLVEELFSSAFLRPRSEGVGFIVALAVYAGGYAVIARSYMTASLLLGLAGFVFAWRRTIQRRRPAPSDRLRAGFRVVALAVPAVLITAWALLTGVAHRNHLLAVKAAEASDGARAAEEKAATKSAAHGFGGYESVILWPFPEKKPIVAPLPLQDGPLAPGGRRPLVIQFDGPYWFLQPPDERPGPHAHQAHGSPLGVRIMANNSDPLVMIARQPLGQPIPLARCGQVEIELDNRDQNLGVVAVVLLLEDSSSKGHPQLDVGRQQIVTGEAESSGLRSFRFRLPARASLRRFDTVAVMFLPESGHERVAPRFAVRELRFYPR